MHDDERLKEKLRAIEALFAGATTEGERQVEWQFSLDPWCYDLLVALARRYGLKPYRYRRQRYSTLIVKASERFLRETFLPEYDAMSKTLQDHLTEVTQRVVAEVLHSDRSAPAVVESEPRQLEAFASARPVTGK